MLLHLFWKFSQFPLCISSWLNIDLSNIPFFKNLLLLLSFHHFQFFCILISILVFNDFSIILKHVHKCNNRFYSEVLWKYMAAFIYRQLMTPPTMQCKPHWGGVEHISPKCSVIIWKILLTDPMDRCSRRPLTAPIVWKCGELCLHQPSRDRSHDFRGFSDMSSGYCLLWYLWFTCESALVLNELTLSLISHAHTYTSFICLCPILYLAWVTVNWWPPVLYLTLHRSLRLQIIPLPVLYN